MNITKTLKMALKKVLSLEMGEISTDKGRLIWDGNDDLKEGDEVFVNVENDDEPQPAPDGEYITEDGKTIVIVEGKVAEIRDAEAEVAPEEVEETIEETQAAEEEEVPAPADEPEVEPEEEETIDSRVAALEEKIAAILDGINGIVNAVAELEGRIAEVEGKLAKVEAPAADPVDETTIEESETPKTKLSYMKRK